MSVRYTDENGKDYYVAGSPSIEDFGDNLTIVANKDGKLSVPIDNKTIFMKDGKLSAKGGGGGSYKLAAPTNITFTAGDEEVKISWTDPDDLEIGGSKLAEWAKTIVIRKEGGAPTSETDGVIVCTETTRNQYSEDGFVDNDVVNGTTYYYGIFPCSKEDLCTTTAVNSATPIDIFPSAVADLVLVGEKDDSTAKITATWTKPSDATHCIAYISKNPTVSSSNYETKSGNITTASGSYEFNGLDFDTTYYVTIYSVNAKGRNSKGNVESIEVLPIKIVTFADGTDQEIIDMINAHYNDVIDVKNYWSVGDARNVSLSAMGNSGIRNDNNTTETHSAQTVQMMIIGFEHDDLVTPINGHTKAAITLDQKECMKLEINSNFMTENGNRDTSLGSMNPSHTNSGGWESCARRNWCRNAYKNALPTLIRENVKNIYKLTSSGSKNSTIKTTSEDVFLLSEIEYFGTLKYSFAGEGNQYEYYKLSSANVYKEPKWSSFSDPGANYWGRSPRYDSNMGFCHVSFAPEYNPGENAAAWASGFAPAFAM